MKEENQAVIKALNMYGRVPEMWELLKEIERLKNREQECIDHYLVQCKYASKMEDKYITANNIINEVREYIKEHPCNTWYYARDGKRELVLCQNELLEILDQVSDE